MAVWYLGKRFCSRTQEAIDLRCSVENAEKLFVYSERRLGKTSLIRKVLAELPEQEYMPAKAAEKEGKRIVAVFDEFQQILEHESDTVERLLRSSIQHQTDVAYIFCGSRKHLIREMFMDSQRPLYCSGAHYPLGLIGESHWQTSIGEKFAPTGKKISAETISAICRLTEGHSFYIRHLCHPIWELCEEGCEVSPDLIEKTTERLLDRESYAFMNLWDSLSRNARRLLKGVGVDGPGGQFFSAEFVRKHQRGSSSNAQRAVEVLLKKDIIDKEQDGIVIPDRFFRL